MLHAPAHRAELHDGPGLQVTHMPLVAHLSKHAVLHLQYCRPRHCNSVCLAMPEAVVTICSDLCCVAQGSYRLHVLVLSKQSHSQYTYHLSMQLLVKTLFAAQHAIHVICSRHDPTSTHICLYSPVRQCRCLSMRGPLHGYGICHLMPSCRKCSLTVTYGSVLSTAAVHTS